MIRNICD